MGVEQLDQLGKVGERAGQPVDLVDNDDVNPSSARSRAGSPAARARRTNSPLMSADFPTSGEPLTRVSARSAERSGGWSHGHRATSDKGHQCFPFERKASRFRRERASR